MACWIHNHLPYSRLQFFPKLCAFNIGWHEHPLRTIQNFVDRAAALELSPGAPPLPELEHFYAGFTTLKTGN